MNKSYSNPTRLSRGWLSVPLFLVGLLGLALSARAQEGSQGNTTIFGGAQMTFFGDHNFLTGGDGTQPGIIGTVRTAPFGVLNFASTATTHTGANDANHVDGYVRKLGTGSFIFPTGDNGHYGPFAAAADGTTGAYFFVDPTSAVTSNLAGGNYPVLPTGGPFPSATKEAALSAVSTKEYWDIDGANATKITLTWSSPSAVGTLTGSNLSHLTIAGWNGTQWVRIPSSFDATSVLGGSSSLTAGSITSTAAITPDTYTAYTLASVLGAPPVAGNDVASTSSGIPVGIDVLGNDTPGGSAIDPTSVKLIDPATSQPVTSLTIAGEGTYAVDPVTGVVTFTPLPTFSGVATAIPYTVKDVDGQTSNTATITVTVTPTSIPNPDVNTTYVGIPVPGNVSTNDKVPAGTTYGTPTASAGNPTGGTLTINPDGIYSFTGTTPGSYTYTVPVCAPGQTSGCPTEPLVITVLPTNPGTPAPPVANTDVASVQGDPTTPSSLTVDVRANDQPRNPGGSLDPPAIVSPPTHGTATVGPDGNIVYTPNPGYYGDDVLTYQVCESPSGLCTTAQEVIHVLPPANANTTDAADDYITTAYNTPTSGNVKTNDTDPQGNTQTVTPQTTTRSAGSLTLNADGSYSFVPASGYSGPASFPYTTCDNGSPQACASATLYVLVAPQTTPPATLNPDANVTYVNIPVLGNVSTNDKVPSGTTYGTPIATAGNPSGGTIMINPDGTYQFTGTTPGSYTYTVPVCAPGQTTGCPTEPLVITVLPYPPAVGSPAPPVALVDIASVKGDPIAPASVTVDVRANDRPETASGTLDPPTIVSPPTHGTAAVGPDGKITYTPDPGYYGDDVLTYQVCEAGTGLCTTAEEVIHVLPPSSTNTTLAADDYVTTTYNTPVSGNVKGNDTDPEGNSQTITASTMTTAAGSLTLNSDGSYRFVPNPGYSGPANFPYTTCDNGTPQACASATLYILVAPPAPDLSPTIFARPSTVKGTSNVTYVVRVIELNGVATSGPITVRVSKDALINLTLPAGATQVGGQPVQNSAWTFGGPSGGFYTLTTNQIIPAGGELWFGLTGTLTPSATDGTLSSSVVIVAGSGGEVIIDNNTDSDSIDYFQQ